jgi:type III secretory pathway component EscU
MKRGTLLVCLAALCVTVLSSCAFTTVQELTDLASLSKLSSTEKALLDAVIRFRQLIILIAIGILIFGVLDFIRDLLFSKELKRRKTELVELKTELCNLDKEMVVFKKALEQMEQEQRLSERLREVSTLKERLDAIEKSTKDDR